MQMIEILDNQSGTARQLLKTRHLAHRIYAWSSQRAVHGRNHVTALCFILL